MCRRIVHFVYILVYLVRFCFCFNTLAFYQRLFFFTLHQTEGLVILGISRNLAHLERSRRNLKTLDHVPDLGLSQGKTVFRKLFNRHTSMALLHFWFPFLTKKTVHK